MTTTIQYDADGMDGQGWLIICDGIHVGEIIRTLPDSAHGQSGIQGYEVTLHNGRTEYFEARTNAIATGRTARAALTAAKEWIRNNATSAID